MTENFDIPAAFRDDAEPAEYCPDFDNAAETFVDYFKKGNISEHGLVFSVNAKASNEPYKNEANTEEGHIDDIMNRQKYFFQNNEYEEEQGNKSNFDKIREQMTDVCRNGKVKKRIKFEGSGDIVPYGARVVFDYVSYLDGCDEPFDSTLNHGKPYCVTLEKDSLLYGLQLGLYSMKPQETSQFLVHYDYAYLASGHMNLIPPKSFILYEVHLISVSNVHILTEFANMPIEDKTKFENAYKVAETLNLKANDLFKNKVSAAIKCYNEAINILEDCHPETASERTQCEDLLIKLLIDVAVCYNRSNEPRNASDACKKVYKLLSDVRPVTAKLLYHDAKALAEIGELKMASNRIRRAIKIAPNNTDVAKLAVTIEEQISEQRHNFKHMSKALIGCDRTKTTDITEYVENSSFPPTFYEFIKYVCDELNVNQNRNFFELFDSFRDEEVEEMQKYVNQHNFRIVRKNKSLYITKKDDDFFEEY